MTQENTSRWLATRNFEEGDIGRLVAWGGLQRPGFMASDRPLHLAAREFLARAEARTDGEYIAVCYRGDETCRADARVFGGPVATLHVTFGQRASVAYVDPGFARDAALARDIETLIDTTAALRGNVARLVA